jgi:hypothetical protein
LEVTSPRKNVECSSHRNSFLYFYDEIVALSCFKISVSGITFNDLKGMLPGAILSDRQCTV